MHDQIAQGLEEHPAKQDVISYLWAALFLIQAAGTALIIRQTRYSTAYNYDQILPLAATALGIAGSIAIGRSPGAK